jgi:GH18 family chitinase
VRKSTFRIKRLLSLFLASALAVALLGAGAVPAFAADAFVGYFNPDRPGQYLPGDFVVEPDTGVVGKNIVATTEGNAWGVGPSSGNGYFEVVGTESDLLDLLDEAGVTIPEFTREKTWTKGDLVQLEGGYYRSLADSTGTVADGNVQSPADPGYGWGFWAPVDLLPAPVAPPVGYWNNTAIWSPGDIAVTTEGVWKCLTLVTGDGTDTDKPAENANWTKLGEAANLLDLVTLPKWNAERRWAIGALVTYNGGVYESIQIAQGAAQSPAEATYWTEKTDLSEDLVVSDKDLAVYFPNWGTSANTINNLPWDRITTLNYAFWEVLEDFTIADTDPTVTDALFAALKQKSEAYGVDVVISIGGWTKCGYFSDMAKNAENRAIFINSCLDVLEEYDWLAGIDIDWEYPGVYRAGSADGSDQGNAVQADGSDGANYTALLQELHDALAAEYGDGAKKLTVCAPANPNNIVTEGEQVNQDLAAIHQYLDRINIMTYDFTGSYDPVTGHHSNLNTTETAEFSVKRIVEFFQGKGVPNGKINIGSPLYSHAWGGVNAEDAATAVNQPGGGGVGDVLWNTLKRMENSIGWVKGYDETAQAAYLYNKDKKEYHTYDSERSLQAKLDYIDSEGLGGIIVWEATGDSADWGYPMLTQMSKGLGLYGGTVPSGYAVEPIPLTRVGMWNDDLDWYPGDYAINVNPGGGFILSLNKIVAYAGSDGRDESPTGTDLWWGYGNGRWIRLGIPADAPETGKDTYFGTFASTDFIFTREDFADAVAAIPDFTNTHGWALGEIVKYTDGKYYVAIDASTGAENPTDDTKWQLFYPVPAPSTPSTPTTPSTPGGGTTGGGGGSSSGGGSTTTTTPPAATETETVTSLPEKTVTASAPSETETAAAETAVAAVAEAAAVSGASVAAVAEPVKVSTGATTPAVTTVTLPESVPAEEITTLAVVNADGSLTPVPTRVNTDGTVTALVSGDVTLVPLHVEPSFTDTDLGTAYVAVTEEINQAAAMMIVEGRGNGIFDPTAEVTTQESVTMFLRAIGVPVQYSSAMTTGTAHGLTTAAAIPGGPTTRIDAAALIVNALKDVGMKPSITAAEADTVLAGFYDLATLTEQEKIDLAICVKLGIFKGYGGSRAGEIGPKEVLQRSHMASLSVRLQDVILGK